MGGRLKSIFTIFLWGVGLWTLTACTPNNVALGPNGLNGDAEATRPAQIEVAREGVFTGQSDEPLPVAQQVPLEAGQNVSVDDEGRAILHFADLLTVELLQGAAVELQQLVLEGPANVAVQQNGGTLIADLTLQPDTEQRLTVQTAFATVTAAGGARFAVVREANSPLEWIVGLQAGQDELQVSSGGLTQPVVGGQARWVAPDDEPGPPIALTRGIEAWLSGIRNNAAQPELGEVLLPPANILADTGTLSTLPTPGQPVDFGQGQGSIRLTLDAEGIFGSPGYALEDCNGDDVQDVAIQNGIVMMDFRQLLARVQALDVTVFNRDEPGNGLLEVLNPAKAVVGRQQVQVGSGALQTLSLRSRQPYHYARLLVSDACFLGVSLTPPDATGEPGQSRPITENVPQSDTVVNILETDTERGQENGQLQAPPVGTGAFAGLIQIDGEQSDWDTLAQQSGVDWQPISAITHDDGCTNRYPDSGSLTDLAGRVQLAYDAQNLYLAFVVNDDGLVTYTGPDERYFLGDSVQVLLDLDLDGDVDDTQLSADDVQVDILPNVDTPQAGLWQLSTLTSSQIAGAVIAVTPTDTGYFVEAALPWQQLNASPQPGDRLGLVASINDNDTPDANAQECIISTSPQRNWRNPATWGTVLLMPPG